MIKKVDRDLTGELLIAMKEDNLMPQLPESSSLPLPAVNKVELYLSFHGNDLCEHCMTNSGPHRKETLLPARAKQAVDNISAFSVISRLRVFENAGRWVGTRSSLYSRLTGLSKPPRILTDRLFQDYADCLMGRGESSRWVGEEKAVPLNFGRPSIRISGGEFYTWPHVIEGAKTAETERLDHQKDLLDYIRAKLPEYDIFILSNGRFAEDEEKTRKVINHWAGKPTGEGGRTHIALSVDPFHRTPANSSRKEMLGRLWNACRKSGIAAPFLYGIPNRRVMLLGRAFESFGCRSETVLKVDDVSKEPRETGGKITLDPVDLVATGGCNELKGFVCRTEGGAFLANNIVIMPSGNLAYCCVCLGNFGNFIENPQQALRNITSDPIAMMLRRKQTAIALLNTAVKLDPTIKVFGEGENRAVAGATCYQVLSGIRLEGKSP